jgi:hypothetical protein
MGGLMGDCWVLVVEDWLWVGVEVGVLVDGVLVGSEVVGDDLCCGVVFGVAFGPLLRLPSKLQIPHSKTGPSIHLLMRTMTHKLFLWPMAYKCRPIIDCQSLTGNFLARLNCPLHPIAIARYVVVIVITPHHIKRMMLIGLVN